MKSNLSGSGFNNERINCLKRKLVLLEDLIFSLVLSETVIANNITSQISAYCLPEQGGFNVETVVSFYSTPEVDGCLVDIFVNEIRVIGALF